MSAHIYKMCYTTIKINTIDTKEGDLCRNDRRIGYERKIIKSN